ncbi:hypothetical protein L3X38_032608 [Prunus dulcis]|uniref:CCHC-type domain-containing protein n=1 Tax=Prunus dulcis TaxID=3755 RepID=A0AAD4VGJ4_PRUDU|nr:hypothetical protein L3X38_032608 [Prunus dulcis]
MEKTVDAIGANLRRKVTVTCTKCFQKGHNKRNCKNRPQDPQLGTYINKRWTTEYPSKKKRAFETNASASEMNARGSQTNAYGSQINVQRRKLPIRKSSSHATLQHVSSSVNLSASASVNLSTSASVNPSAFVHPTPRQGPRLLGASSSAPWKPPGKAPRK